MLSQAASVPTFSRLNLSAAGGTPFIVPIPFHPRRKAKLTYLQYTPPANAQQLTLMSPFTKFAALVAPAVAGATTFQIGADPGKYSLNLFPGATIPEPSVADNPISANHIVAIQGPDRILTVFKVASVAVANNIWTITISTAGAPYATAIPTQGYPTGARMFFFGLLTDTNPLTGLAHPTVPLASSTPLTLGANNQTVFESNEREEPILIYSNNATLAGTLNWASGVYADE